MSDVLSKTLSKKGFAKTAAYVDSQKDSDVKFITMRELLRDIINPLVQKAETDVRALRIVAGVLPLLRSNELIPEKSKPAGFKVPKPDGNIAKYASVVEELFIDGPYSETLVKIAAYVPKGQGNIGLSVKKAEIDKDISLLWVPESWFEEFVGSKFSKTQQRKASVTADAMMKLAYGAVPMSVDKSIARGNAAEDAWWQRQETAAPDKSMPQSWGLPNPSGTAFKLKKELANIKGMIDNFNSRARNGTAPPQFVKYNIMPIQEQLRDLINRITVEMPAIRQSGDTATEQDLLQTKGEAMKSAYWVRSMLGQQTTGTGATNSMFGGVDPGENVFTPQNAATQPIQ